MDGNVVTQAIEQQGLGRKIRRLRLNRSMSLSELGEHTGLSASFLSQLETGKIVPTLQNLTRVAMVFSKGLNYFFQPESRKALVVHRKSERVRLPQSRSHHPAYWFESLGFKLPERALDPYWAKFSLDSKLSTSHAHSGLEFIFVIRGVLEINIGETAEKLLEGDALLFDASVAHAYRSTSKPPAEAIVVTCPQIKQSDLK